MKYPVPADFGRVLLFSILVAGCSGSADLSSSWSKETVTIDGSADEWTSRLVNMKDTQILMGVQNDQDFVYVCLMSQEEQFRRQIMGQGLIVWFESEDGRRLGVHYPMGSWTRGRAPLSGTDGTRDPGVEDKTGEQNTQEMEILGPGKDEHHLVSVLELPGIRAKVGTSRGSVVYELMLPLKESGNQPYAVGTAPGSMVKLRIETGKFDSAERQRGGTGGGTGGGSRGGRRGSGPPGGGGMGGGGRSGGGRSGRDGGGSGRPEPLEIKADVHLAGSPSRE